MISNQKGFTLIEVIVDVAISGMLIGALIPFFFQVTRTSETITDEMTGTLQVQNAVHWISRDVKLAASTNLVEGAPSVDNLTIQWTYMYQDINQEHTVQYYVSEGYLKRSYDSMVINVAQCISNIEFSLNSSVITVDVTCHPDEMSEQYERGIYNVTLRQ
ncbi:type II secretion system protein J [Chloroflexota bacterium]